MSNTRDYNRVVCISENNYAAYICIYSDVNITIILRGIVEQQRYD